MHLLQHVSQHASGELQRAATLPPDVRLDFDPAAEGSKSAADVIKTSRRTVIGLAGRCPTEGHARSALAISRGADRLCQGVVAGRMEAGSSGIILARWNDHG